MDFAPLLDASLAIQLHALAAVLAFALGGFVLFRRKGDRLHRMGGRIWVGLMILVAVSSFFIHTIRLVGPWSPIHLVSVFTLLALVHGVGQARARRIVDHRRTMQSTYVGALVIAGVFTFMPGRIMFEVFFGGPSPLAGVTVAAVIVAVSGFMAWRGRTRTGETPRARP